MSSDTPSTDRGPEKDNATTSRKNSKAAPARSPIERAVVWGLIAVLLVIVTWEFTAHLGYTKALRGLQERVQQSESGEPFLASEVNAVVGGKGPASHEEVRDPEFGRCIREAYEWNGPIRKRTILVMIMVGSENHVMGFRTEGAAESSDVPPAERQSDKEGLVPPTDANPPKALPSIELKEALPETKTNEPSKT